MNNFFLIIFVLLLIGCGNENAGDDHYLDQPQTQPQGNVVERPPVSTEPETPVSTEPEIPVITEPETPVSTEPDTPVSTEPDTPVSVEPKSSTVLANAGEDQFVFERDLVFLTAEEVVVEAEESVEYKWKQLSGVEVNLNSDNIYNPTFDLPYIAVDEYLDFQLTVTKDSNSASDTVRIFVTAIEESLPQEPSIKLLPCTKTGLTDELVSLHDGKVVKQCFSNQSSQALRSAWIDYNGVNRVWKLINPGEEVCSTVESAHLYYVGSSLYQCRFYFLPSPEQPNVVITDELLTNLPYQHSSAQGDVLGLEGNLTLQADRTVVTISHNGMIDLGQISSLNIANQPENQTCSINTHPGKNPHWINAKNQVFINKFTITCTDICPSRILPNGTKILRDCGPINNRVGLVFIGDGFTQEELTSTWQPHVASVTSRMLNEEEPYARYHKFINVYRVDTISNESGIDDLIKGTNVDTALGGHRELSNTCWLDWRLAHEIIDDALGEHPQHWKVMALNYATCAGRANTLYGAIYPTLSLINYEVMLHEAGHAFFNLGDEYFTVGETHTGEEIKYENLTHDQLSPPWEHWLGYEQPHLDGPISTYEGGYYREFGVWRPSSVSLMENGFHPFDIVAIEAAILEIYQHVNPIDSHTNNSQPLTAFDSIQVQVVDSHVIKVKWYLNGEILELPETQILDLSSLKLVAGQHIIEAKAYDEILDYNFSDNQNPHPLDLVRKDLDRLEQTVRWDVLVQ